jgi:hypothetical protein
MARSPWVERVWGQDQLTKRHRLVGFTSFWLMWVHILLITVGYAQAAHRNLIAEGWNLIIQSPGMLLAAAGTLALIAVVVTSIRRSRRRLRYASWHLIHLYAYLGVGLALPITQVTVVGPSLMWADIWATALVARSRHPGPPRLLAPKVRRRRIPGAERVRRCTCLADPGFDDRSGPARRIIRHPAGVRHHPTCGRPNGSQSAEKCFADVFSAESDPAHTGGNARRRERAPSRHRPARRSLRLDDLCGTFAGGPVPRLAGASLRSVVGCGARQRAPRSLLAGQRKASHPASETTVWGARCKALRWNRGRSRISRGGSAVRRRSDPGWR